MHLIVIAALAAVCGAAKLDRTYLPPPSAQTAGGSPGALQTPFGGASFRSQGNQGLGGIPKGAYSNDFGGVVVDAAAAGTRAAGPEETGLGAPRPSYGSQVSKVGDAAFRGAPVAGFRQTPAPQGDEDNVNAATNGNPSERFGNGNDQQGSRFQASSSAAVRSQPSRFDSPSFNAEPVEAERPKAEQERQAGILRYNSEVGADSYSYSFETDNGISAEENGVAINGVQAQGAFSYTGDDGQTYSVTYTADENGYQPRGDHLPTPPPIPDAILKSLELNAKEEAAGLSDDGSYDARKYNAASDYNESDNNNGRYNRAESNKGSGNGVIASAEAVSGLAKQNGAFKQTQNRQGNDFNSQAPSQSGQIGDRFGNNDNFLQSPSAAAQNGLRQDSGNNAYAVASQSSGNVAGGFGQVFQGSFAQQKPDQRFRGQSVNNGNKFYQQSQDQGSVFGENDNNLGQQTKEQASVFGDQSSSTNVNKFSQHTEAHSSKFGAPPSDITFGQQTQSQIGQFAATSQSTSFGQKTQAQTSGAPSSQGQASGFNVQSTGSANNFGQHTQAQASGFGGQKFGYLPPKQNGGRTPQGSKVPETTAFNSQSQSSFQQSNNIASQIRPTKQPDTTLTTPFETPRIDSASQLASSENGETVQVEQKPSFTGQFSEASAEVKLPQSSFSRRPSNQGNGFDRFPQKSGVRPQAQNFRQQNIPVANSSGKPQGSASAFASFNSQETVASAENFNSDDEEPTTGVAYTDTTPTTESPAQFGQFEQAQNQYNQASQGQFNQGFQPQNRPQFSGSTQKPFRHNNFVQQQTSNNGQDNSYYYKQPSTSFNVPETSNNNFQSTSSGQFDRVTEQPNFDTQSSAQLASSQTGQFGSHTNFQGQQSSTKYPRPPTLLAVDPTLTVNTETDIPQTTYQAQYNNGVTQASASSFASNNPSSQFNGSSSQKFPQRKQFSQFNTQATQSFSRPQSSSFGQQTTAVPSSFSQQNQYDQSGNGFNQFSGAQTFRQRVTNNPQFGKQEPKKEPTTEVPASTYEGEIYQYNKPAEVLPAPSQDPTPQGSEETPVQFDAKQPDQRVQSQNQFQRNQFSQDFGQQVDERVPFQQESSEFVGGSAAFKVDGDTASSVAGKGEVFGGPRQPPSFDEETGYHY